MNANGIADSNYDIICFDDQSNKLFEGLFTNSLDGSNESSRPIEMDLQLPYSFISSLAARPFNNNEVKDLMIKAINANL